jgi:hypothetical protein
MFVDCMNVRDNHHTAKYLVKETEQIMYKFGGRPNKFVTIGDNAVNVNKTGQLIKKEDLKVT